MLNKFKSYLEISNFERRGLFALLFLLLFVSGYYYYINSKGESDPFIDSEKLAEFKAEIDNSLLEPKYFEEKNLTESREPSKRTTIRPFNPQLDDFNTLLEKGVPYYAVKNIVNFRNKGGEFRVKSDLKKLYSIDDKLFGRLLPYVLLPDVLPRKTYHDSTAFKIKTKPIAIVDINSASAEELRSISGIGSFYAKTIIERRTKLGGFHSAAQLDEVYGLSDETIEKIKPFLRFNEGAIHKLSVNRLTYEDLAKHAYLSYKEARAIVNYKEQHGSYTELDQIQKLHIFKGKDLSRILPYLDLN